MKVEVRALCAGYGAKLVLDNVNMEIPAHGIVTLLGPNGCGKSTLIKIISGKLSADRGSFEFKRNKLDSGSMPD